MGRQCVSAGGCDEGTQLQGTQAFLPGGPQTILPTLPVVQERCIGFYVKSYSFQRQPGFAKTWFHIPGWSEKPVGSDLPVASCGSLCCTDFDLISLLPFGHIGYGF